MSRLRGRAAPQVAPRDEIHIEVSGGYRPAVATARAGVPIRIVFERLDDDACTERVIFSSPRLERRLTTNGPTSVDLPAHPRGEIRYTCGMGRYSGIIRVVDADRDRSGWLRHEGRTADSVPAVVFVVTVVGLPVVATMALLLLGGMTALVATAAAAAAVGGAVLWLLSGSDGHRRGRKRRNRSDAAKPGFADTDPTPSTRRIS